MLIEQNDEWVRKCIDLKVVDGAGRGRSKT